MNQTAIRAEYVSGDASLLNLARKYQIPKSTLYDLARKEDWPAQREDYRQRLSRQLLLQCERRELAAAQALLETTDSLSNWLAEIVGQLRTEYRQGAKVDLRVLRDAVAILRELRTLTEAEAQSPAVQVVFAGQSGECCG